MKRKIRFPQWKATSSTSFLCNNKLESPNRHSEETAARQRE